MLKNLITFVIDSQRIICHVFLGKVIEVLPLTHNVKVSLIEIKNNSPQEAFEDTVTFCEFGHCIEEVINGAEFVMVDGYYSLPNGKRVNFNYVWFEE